MVSRRRLSVAWVFSPSAVIAAGVIGACGAPAPDASPRAKAPS
jgi:hypothetical protein